MTKRELLAKMKVLGSLDDDTRNNIVCSFIGHSRIQSVCFGYFYCGRCEDQVGDTLAAAYDASKVVIISHDCPTCRDNFKTLTWRDKLYAPDPFAPKTAE